jgi:hypothetical protein
MPQNALAPTPANALSQQSLLAGKAAQLPAEWANLLRSNSAAYEIATLLNATGQLPKIGFAKLSETGRSGEYDRQSNSITLNTDSKNLASTLPHELTHALRYVMRDKVRGIGEAARQTGVAPAGADKQLFDAWTKLDPDFSKLPTLRYPDAAYNRYRHSFAEAPAFAVGNMDSPQNFRSRGEYLMTNPGGSHVDATLATEQAILRDLYAKQLKLK